MRRRLRERADVSPIAADGFSNFPRITRVCKDLRATAIRITVNSKGRAGMVKNRLSVQLERTHVREYCATVVYLGVTYGYTY